MSKHCVFTTVEKEKIDIPRSLIRSIARNGNEPAVIETVDGAKFKVADTVAEKLIEELFKSD